MPIWGLFLFLEDLRGAVGWKASCRGHWDRSSGGVRACQIVLHANPCIPVGRLADPLSPYHCTDMYLRCSWVIKYHFLVFKTLSNN